MRSIWDSPIGQPSKPILTEEGRKYLDDLLKDPVKLKAFQDEVEKDRKERQAACLHEDVICWGPSWVDGRKSPESYHCRGCGYVSKTPIGQYVGTRPQTFQEAMQTILD